MTGNAFVSRRSTRNPLGNYDEEYRIIKSDDSIRWIRDRAFPVKDQAGEIHRIVGVAEDITERKQVQHGLQALAEASWELTGPTLFQTLVWEVAAILNVKFAFIAEHLDQNRARTHASLADGSFLDPMEYSLTGRPAKWRGRVTGVFGGITFGNTFLMMHGWLTKMLSPICLTLFVGWRGKSWGTWPLWI